MSAVLVRPVAKHSPRASSRLVELIDTVVLHATDGGTASSTIDWFRNGKLPDGRPVQASYHVLVEDDGKRFRLVNDDREAWHAGRSSFDGRANVNDFSLGLAWCIRNNGREPITPAAWDAAALQCREWVGLYPRITRARLVTHAMVSPGRKTDVLAAQLDLEAFRRAVFG